MKFFKNHINIKPFLSRNINSSITEFKIKEEVQIYSLITNENGFMFTNHHANNE